MASGEGVRGGRSKASRSKKRAPAGAPAAPKIARPAGAEMSSETAATKKPPPAASELSSAGNGDLVVVTLKASTGSIVSVEIAAADGSRHPLTDGETERLVGERPTFASLVHDAFEAGIACVLDDGGADETGAESEEDVDLHDALLDALIERSAAKRLLRRETLQSAALSTIIHSASGGETAGSASASGAAA
jgi:hypothetical protein